MKCAVTGWSKVSDMASYKPRWRPQVITKVRYCSSYFNRVYLNLFNGNWNRDLKKATICTEYPECEESLQLQQCDDWATPWWVEKYIILRV